MNNTGRSDASFSTFKQCQYHACSRGFLSPASSLDRETDYDFQFSDYNSPMISGKISDGSFQALDGFPEYTEEFRESSPGSLDPPSHIVTGVSGKPCSYAQLIAYAISTSSTQKMTLSELYKWCTDNFPYFKESPSQSWKNTIRHNLSLNRNFIRVPRPVNEPGKGSYWTLSKFGPKHGVKVPDRQKSRGRPNSSHFCDSSLGSTNKLDEEKDSCYYW